MIDNINDLPEKIINIEKITFKDFKGEGRVLKIDFTAYQYMVPQNLSRNPLYQSLCCTNINQITLGNTQHINKQSTYCSKIRTHTLG